MTFDVSNVFIPSEALAQTKPRIHWIMADSNASQCGFWYSKSTPDADASGLWADSSFRDDFGYQSDTLRCIAVCSTSRPFSVDENGMKVFSEKYEKGMKFYTEVATIVEGYAEPMIVTVKGASGVAWQNAMKQVDAWRATVKSNSRVNLPRYAFWLELVPQRTPQGKPLLTDLYQGNKRNLFALATPSPSIEELRAMYIGNALMQSIGESYADYKALIEPSVAAAAAAGGEEDGWPPF
ncbi:MAG: hypothetical protein HC911_18185 [Chloroflexaceae bacterium]|nr:hypothetical protein [Chloroflexaceae bacterium]